MKVLVIGLDAAPPELLFEKFIDKLPNFKKLISNGVYGRLRSCIPAITIPAWMVMMTGQTPGELGLYGFRHRRGYSYNDIWIANSQAIKTEAVWDILRKEDRKVCLVGVPPSYPPFDVNGNLISCFITPGGDKDYTYPTELKEEIEDLVGEYIFDVEFRVENRKELLSRIYEMTEQRFKVLKHLIQTKEWDFFMWVEIGVDRIQHSFWKFFDKGHHLYQPGNEFETAIPDYYEYLDDKVGEILSLTDDDTAVLVVSDHGAKGMKGAFCINEWLAQEGYLALKTKPQSKVNLQKAEVDWSRTKAWGWGGYYARIFLNVEGREPQGVINPEEYEKERDEIAHRLAAIKGPDGESWETKVFTPESIYPQNGDDSPDLMVYFDNLSWRAAGTMGHGTMYLPENDTGPDDAVHAEDGVYIVYLPEKQLGGKKKDLSIYDIAPTTLSLLGIPIPSRMKGNPLKV